MRRPWKGCRPEDQELRNIRRFLPLATRLSTIYASYDPLRYNKISACRNRKPGCTITILWIVILRKAGARKLCLGKRDDGVYDHDDSKVWFGDDDDDDDDEDNDDHHDGELSFGSCFGSAWQLFQKISISFLVTISKILRSYWMSYSVF
jgi:hypothetical protein